MNKYDSYKDSGVEWIGAIPKSWSLKRIKHTTYVKGRIGWKGLRSDEFRKESDSIAVTGTDFKNGKIDWENCYQISRNRYDEDPYIQLKEDDLLITKDGTIGKIALVEDMPKVATLNSGIFVTRPLNMEYSNKFLYWVLVSDIFSAFYDFNKSGSTIQHLYQYVFNEFNFPLPSKEEQTAIITYLNQKTIEIDNLITKKERLIKLLEEEKTAIINHAVTKGLNPDVPMKDSGVEWLGEIPEHWEIGKFTFYIKIRHGHQFLNADFTDDGLRVVKITQLHKDGYLDLSKCSFVSEKQANKYKDILIKENDILMCLTGGTIGKIIRVGNVTEPLLQNYRVGHFSSFNEEDILDDYIFWLMSSEALIAQIFFQMRETGQPNIGMEDFSRMKITLPPLREQKEISIIISSKIQELQLIKKKIINEINLLKEYKTALISNVVTGKIDVRDKVMVN